MEVSITHLTSFQFDALKEVGNIGMGNAATSLADIIKKKVIINIPDLKLELIENIQNNISVEADSLVMGILMQIEGDIQGYILVLFQTESARQVCNMMGGTCYKKITSKSNWSLMDNVGTRLSETYLNALSDFLGIKASASRPYNCYDMAGATLDNILIEMSYEAKQALVFDTKFTIAENTTSFNILTLLDPPSLELILKKIDQMIEQG